MEKQLTAEKKNKSKRLLIATTTFPRWENDSGPAPFVFELARFLNRYFQITVFAPHFPGSARQEVWKGMEIVRFRYFFSAFEILADGRGLQNHFRESLKAKLLVGFLILGEFWAGFNLLRKRKYDAINSHWLIPSGLLFSILASWRKIPHICTVHAGDFYLLLRIPLGKRLLRFIASRSRALICVNQRMAETIKKFFPQAQVYVMPMGVEVEKFSQIDPLRVNHLKKQIGIENEKIILFVGKLSEKKGIEWLLDAFELLLKEGGDFQLLLVGEGSQRKTLEEKVEKKGIGSRVNFLGAVPYPEIPYYYHLADVVVVPSQIDRYGEGEGMPVVVLEALASGKPVVGSRYCFVPDELKSSGFIEVGLEPEEIARGIKRALEDKEKPKQSAIQRFSWERIAEFYAEVLKG